MALISCPECEHLVSDSARECPNCGHPLVGDETNAGEPALAAATALKFTVAGASAIVIGSLLPWVSVTTIFGSISISGTEGDGVFTMIGGAIIGSVAGVVLSRRSASKGSGVLIILIGLASGLIAFNVSSNLANAADLSDSGVLSSIGGGLWLVILGSATAIGSGFSVATARGGGPQSRNAWMGVGIGVAVVAVLLVALTVYVDAQGEVVSRTFEDIASELQDP